MAYRKPDTAGIERSIAGLSNSLSALIVGAVGVAAVCGYMAVTSTPSFALGLLALVPLVAVILHLSRKRRTLRDLLAVRNDWGAPRIDKDRDLKAASLLFGHTYGHDAGSDHVDEQTWKDLNMDQLYARVDRTYTDPGEAVLYRMLRVPIFNKAELAERSRVINFFQNNQDPREGIQLILRRLGHQFVRNDLCDLLWRDDFPKSRLRPLLSLMALAAVASLVAPVALWALSLATASSLWSDFAILLLMIPAGIFIINLLTHHYIKRSKDIETLSFPYLLRCIATARELSSLECEDLKPYTSRLSDLFEAVRGIPGRARLLFPADQSFADPLSGFILEYLNIFFLWEVRAFFATADELSRHVHELREMYIALGELDALQAAASYRSSLESYSEPAFVEDGIHLEVAEARQPLLDKPVPASISFGRNVVIITGSNMGGKSTFLRTIGNNVLLAETIATTVTSHYCGSFFRIISSISRTDDLISGRSFYYVEAERILRAIQSLDDKRPTLCLIDEMLSGTNSTERLQASEAIIRYLTAQNTLTVIATHDVELAERLDGECDFYHFTDNVDENGLKFDYLLKPGVATTRNAVALLRYLGYPGEITKDGDR